MSLSVNENVSVSVSSGSENRHAYSCVSGCECDCTYDYGSTLTASNIQKVCTQCEKRKSGRDVSNSVAAGDVSNHTHHLQPP